MQMHRWANRMASKKGTPSQAKVFLNYYAYQQFLNKYLQCFGAI